MISERAFQAGEMWTRMPICLKRGSKFTGRSDAPHISLQHSVLYLALNRDPINTVDEFHHSFKRLRLLRFQSRKQMRTWQRRCKMQPLWHEFWCICSTSRRPHTLSGGRSGLKLTVLPGDATSTARQSRDGQGECHLILCSMISSGVTDIPEGTCCV